MQLSILTSAVLVAAAGLHAQADASARRGEPDVGYDRDVRPILADRCFRCHGPDPRPRQAELRLDVRESALAARKGVTPIAPGDLDHSELWRRVTTDDPDDSMPPPASGKPRLSAAEREQIAAWIRQGARYEPHWSFVPPARPIVPEVRQADWCKTEVDAFVLAQLERAGIAPSPLAAPGTQMRRLYLALTGLPPTPEETAAFAADPSDAAYDRIVDRLLAEEPWRSRYAERMATPWLDGARYADTSGIHMDAGRQMWAYRDWVLAAFRDNLPFDQFVIDQLAGDLLPDATLAQKVATGFHRCHVTTDEGGAIDAEYLVEYAADRTATTGSVFLGLTLGCARCHEHKYDPISQDDYYRVFAYFDSIAEPGLYSQSPDPNRALEPFLSVPSPEQQQAQQRLQRDLEAAQQALAAQAPGEDLQQQAFVRDVRAAAALQWPPARVVSATSQGGATMTLEPDGSVLASGANPAQDVHEFHLGTDATGLRLLCLEALPDATLGGRVGRAPNGNAVLMALDVVAIARADPSQRVQVPLVWAWADVEQQNGDFGVVNALAADDGVGWAVAAHEQPPGPRTALFLAAEPFGFPGGTDVVVTLRYDSVYSQHAFGRVRLSLGSLADEALARLPVARGRFHVAGPFAAEPGADPYAAAHEPGQARALDRGARFGTAGKDARRWVLAADHAEGKVNMLAEGVGVTYVGQQLFAPSARTQSWSLGSDDGFALRLDGEVVAQRRVDRSVARDQDRADVALAPGSHLLVLEVVNTGGGSGYYLQPLRPDAAGEAAELTAGLAAALLPASALAAEGERLRAAWRELYSPDYVRRKHEVAALEAELAALDARIPRTMVMKELPQPRPTFVLQRGQYDRPDPQRPVERGIPAALGQLPPGAPDDRLGLSRWLVAPDNPLVARVRVNRLWELLFGTGLVRTAEDFGMQGEWPSHRELLDWLAVEFRDRGWDQQRVLRLIVRSATFRQLGRVRPEVREHDPDDRWLSWYPRRRLSAEQLRDQALYVGGILVEKFGGPSVKPYQPPGLWREVAMVQSNTREYRRGAGEDLFRRSLYTYWKRACPPPDMLALDAPTREFCTIRRLTTNTPLQALVLWNDEQYVEAARALAERTLREPGDDRARLGAMFARCTAAAPAAAAVQRLRAALDAFRRRYEGAPQDAAALLATGTRPRPDDLQPAELAAWTLIASAILNLDATLCTP